MTGGENRKQSILLVEDDLHVRTCFESLLEFDGHEVKAVDGGEAALAVLERETFDLVITDYWMPRMKGDELARLIKERWPDQPIILASGSLANINNFQSSTPGVDCMLNKPFTLPELREAITWVLDQHAESNLPGPEITGLMGGQPKAPDAAKRSTD